MLGVLYPMTPRLLWLMFQVPMSSPQITRILGLDDCANAEAANANDSAAVIRSRSSFIGVVQLMPEGRMRQRASLGFRSILATGVELRCT